MGAPCAANGCSMVLLMSLLMRAARPETLLKIATRSPVDTSYGLKPPPKTHAHSHPETLRKVADGDASPRPCERSIFASEHVRFRVPTCCVARCLL